MATLVFLALTIVVPVGSVGGLRNLNLLISFSRRIFFSVTITIGDFALRSRWQLYILLFDKTKLIWKRCKLEVQQKNGSNNYNNNTIKGKRRPLKYIYVYVCKGYDKNRECRQKNGTLKQ